MILDITIDQALIELKRTEKALLALREQRKSEERYCPSISCEDKWVRRPNAVELCPTCTCPMAVSVSGPKVHATAKRASLDLTRKLADLRAGR